MSGKIHECMKWPGKKSQTLKNFGKKPWLYKSAEKKSRMPLKSQGKFLNACIARKNSGCKKLSGKKSRTLKNVGRLLNAGNHQ